MSEDTKSQRDRFIKTARALGANEDEAAFKEKLAVISRQKPKLNVLDTDKSKEIEP